MKMIFLLFTILFLSFSGYTQNQNRGVIEGRVLNSKNNEPVIFANVVIWQSGQGVVSDDGGNFILEGIKPGYVELRVSSVGYKTFISQDVFVTNSKRVYIDIELEEASVELDEITIMASPFRKTEESPVSLRRIGIAEIEKSPGGNRDISKVIQSFPGVSSTVAYRNDVIVRGGGPNENRFYLDGVEIPNINHFATQGASGGPVGIINVDFIREVNFYSGAFPANKGNALSSILDFRQVDGNREKLIFKTALGASDLGLTLDGPLGDNTSFIFSVRRSYLQFLFSAIGLPFLPTYNDFQFKTKTRFDKKNELILIGIGAIDQFELNTKANETEEQRYILSYLPVNEQSNYTIGAVYKHYRDNGFDTYVLSRNYLNNVSYKYRNNIEVDSLKILDYSSIETENKFRYEKDIRTSTNFKINIGFNLEHARYYNSTFRAAIYPDESIDYETTMNLLKWGIFGHLSKSVLRNRLSLSLGMRVDATNYSESMNSMFNQFSPRFSASYTLSEKLFLNFNVGRYYQLPSYTTLGFANSSGVLLNKENNLKYISSDHLVAGMEFLPDEKMRFTLEGFYKTYNNYPFSLSDSVSIASKGGGYGTFGDEEVVSISEGRAFGLEMLARFRMVKGFNAIFAYTLVRSKFNGVNSDYIPSAWDNKHILSFTIYKILRKNWELGIKWRYVGGAPYTPWDVDKSELRVAWDAQGRGYLDYSRFNSLRLKPFHQLDVRVDKEYFFDKWSLNIYMDIQNFYNFKADEPDNLLLEEDVNNMPVIVNPTAVIEEQRYQSKLIESKTGTVLPTIGIIIQF